MKNDLKKLVVIGLIFLFLGASATVGVSANQTKPAAVPMDRDFHENFDEYTNGQLLDGTPDDGGWGGWDENPAAYGTVTDAQYRSAPYSDMITGDSDNIHQFPGYTSGQWVFTAWQYIPTDFSGETYFILLSDYATGGSSTVDKWAVQVHFDSATGFVESEFDYVDLPLITGQWVQLRLEIDLNADLFSFFYNNELLISKAWTAGVNNDATGLLNISTVDLFANGASPVYYDDISLTPPVTELTVDAGGPYTGEAGQPVQFTGFASGGTEPYTWAWDFGDGETSDVQSPIHTYDAAGVYNVTLTVTDAAEQTASDTAVATITAPQPKIEIGAITGGVGVNAVIKNTGNADAQDVAWNIGLNGGLILLGKSTSGEVDIPMGTDVTVKSGLILGFGKTTITVTADVASGTATGTVFLILVLKVA